MKAQLSDGKITVAVENLKAAEEGTCMYELVLYHNGTRQPTPCQDLVHTLSDFVRKCGSLTMYTTDDAVLWPSNENAYLEISSIDHYSWIVSFQDADESVSFTIGENALSHFLDALSEPVEDLSQP